MYLVGSYTFPVKFYYVYVLDNPNKNFIYVGYSENLWSRFVTHKSGRVKSTKVYIHKN